MRSLSRLFLVFFILLLSACKSALRSSEVLSESTATNFSALGEKLAEAGIKFSMSSDARKRQNEPYARKVLEAFYQNEEDVIKKLFVVQKGLHVKEVVIDTGPNQEMPTHLNRDIEIFIGDDASIVSRRPEVVGHYKNLGRVSHVLDNIVITVATDDTYLKGVEPVNVILNQIYLARALQFSQPGVNSLAMVDFFIPARSGLTVAGPTRSLAFSNEAFLLDRDSFGELTMLVRKLDFRELYARIDPLRSLKFGFVDYKGVKEGPSADNLYIKIGKDPSKAIEQAIANRNN